MRSKKQKRQPEVENQNLQNKDEYNILKRKTIKELIAPSRN